MMHEDECKLFRIVAPTELRSLVFTSSNLHAFKAKISGNAGSFHVKRTRINIIARHSEDPIT